MLGSVSARFRSAPTARAAAQQEYLEPLLEDLDR